MGIFSGLKNLGLGELEDSDLFAEEEKAEQAAAEPAQPEEKDFIYEKSYTCPVCDKTFSSRVMKTGKAKLVSMDLDLRPRYVGIDATKYDVELCPHCKYAALTRYFTALTAGQIHLIKEQISNKVKLQPHSEDYYTYEEAIERYKIALVCAMVKKAKNSEKAYICLKSAWLLRGYREELESRRQLLPQQREELTQQETEYLENAFKGFVEAQKSERYPMCGMDEYTMDYLTAALAYEVGELDMSSQYVSRLLASMANNRVKDKARDLKEMIVAKRKELGN
ncbi:hypothetical protein IMSAGC003_00280 [Lachnospiraceae bacterium]|jgi:uncharacterized protein (DUF2225 family)|nr:DUF2225 domain-containing protein [Lachnospiraceae bacterium]MCX4270952.1 DUF2225 domain-containing protein [Acetatifactor sp.]GFH93752.1 hypothetical protein IMSAGC003_00280 [Lachnospiraceae bacterium]